VVVTRVLVTCLLPPLNASDAYLPATAQHKKDRAKVSKQVTRAVPNIHFVFTSVPINGPNSLFVFS